VSLVVRVLKDRSIFLEPVEGKPYYIRLKELQTGKTIQGMTHNKGTMISPRFLLQILERFDIPIPDFLEDVATLKRGPQRV